MKRYDSDEEGVMRESKDGMWNLHSDLSAHMLKLKEVVEGMRHERMCLAHASVHDGPFTMKWIINNSLCNCHRGHALRLIGEVLK